MTYLRETGDEYPYDIAIVCPGIKPWFWLSLHEQFVNQNKANFIIIFIGHIRPDFDMPDHTIHIYSEMGLVPCVDIGYEYIFDHNLAPYTAFIGDDLLFDRSPFLDQLILSYEKYKPEYPDRSLAISNLSENGGGGYDLMGWNTYDDWGRSRLTGVTLGGTWLLTIDDAKKLGGGCKSFAGCYQHVDKQLRFYSELNGIIMVLNEDEIASTREIHNEHNNHRHSNSNKTGQVDSRNIRSLYTFTKLSDNGHGEEKYEVFFTTRTPGREGINHFEKQRWKVERTRPILSYSKSELIYEEPNTSHLSTKF